MSPTSLGWVKVTLFATALAPLALIVSDAFTGDLGANPVETVSRRTGIWTLRLLLATLAITPLRLLTGWNPLARLRRMLGLFAFFYLCLHVATYLVLDAALDPAYLLEDLTRRRYITAGATGLALLIPLAATSTAAMQRRLGGRRWKRLHRAVYVAAAAGVLHFAWLIKADYSRPLLYGTVLALLLATRVPAASRVLSGVRHAAWGRGTATHR